MTRIGTSVVCATLMALVATAWLCGSAQGQTYEAAVLNQRAIELDRAGKAGERAQGREAREPEREMTCLRLRAVTCRLLLQKGFSS